MIQKIKELLGSRRFWIVTAVSVLSVVQVYNPEDAQLSQILDILKGYLLTVVGIGTIDSIAGKMGKAIAGGKK